MTVPIRQHCSSLLSFEEQLLYVLLQLKKRSAGEIAIELMKLQGVSTEEGVANLTIHTEKQLEKLCADNVSCVDGLPDKKHSLIFGKKCIGVNSLTRPATDSYRKL
jgi:hypothetical protein